MGTTHLHELVCPLLPFLAHGLGGWAGEQTCDVEDDAGETDEEDGAAEDAPALAWWDFSSWAVWAESDPVRCCGVLAVFFVPFICLSDCCGNDQEDEQKP